MRGGLLRLRRRLHLMLLHDDRIFLLPNLVPSELLDRLRLQDAAGLDDFLDFCWLSLGQAGRSWQDVGRVCRFLWFFLVVKGRHLDLNIPILAIIQFLSAAVWYEQTAVRRFLGLRRDCRLLLKVNVWLEQVDFLVAGR